MRISCLQSLPNPGSTGSGADYCFQTAEIEKRILPPHSEASMTASVSSPTSHALVRSPVPTHLTSDAGIRSKRGSQLWCRIKMEKERATGAVMKGCAGNLSWKERERRLCQSGVAEQAWPGARTGTGPTRRQCVPGAGCTRSQTATAEGGASVRCTFACGVVGF
ncbi:hypothetical protein D4764_02G0010970 [Takifugu flavidus]|uniref:Uncharacterized protein n=1 Tax=Takifugu flavidus TaxID=433684 RepID=A0A5C6NLZ4_9TELE|nr:hypothetical protein D4764_02G0010970 [Takifugu flavidus]